MKHQFIIAAPNSNAGKTTITLGLLRLFKKKNISVQPFKIGPDYIDPKFHQLACSSVGVNLDLFMMTPDEINQNLRAYGKDMQVNCIEGVMGLFDGAQKDKGSTADLSKKLQTPVLLVIDAKAVAYSVAPLIQGFVNFDKNVSIMGVVFNRVGSSRHYKMLQEACEDIGVPCFGYLSKLKDITIPSRHLGLNIDQIEKFDVVIDQIATELAHTLDWKAVLDASQCSESLLNVTDHTIENKQDYSKKIKFAVAKDAAFNFIYPQNISAMEALGEVEFFSPIHDRNIPDCDFIYLPGGYPESYLKELSSNTSMLDGIRNFAENNGQIYAECGGMMYLGKSILSEQKESFKMVGYFNFDTTLADKKLHLGYRTSKMPQSTFKGHEFHYSSLINDKEVDIDAVVLNAREENTNTKIYKKNKVIATYIHHYFGTPELLLAFINHFHIKN